MYVDVQYYISPSILDREEVLGEHLVKMEEAEEELLGENVDKKEEEADRVRHTYIIYIRGVHPTNLFSPDLRVYK